MSKTHFKSYLSPGRTGYTITRFGRTIGYSPLEGGVYGIAQVIATYLALDTDFIFRHFSLFCECISTEERE